MNIFKQISLGAMLGWTTLLPAQTAPQPDNLPVQASATPATAPSPTAPIEPPSLIPANILPGPGAAAMLQAPAAADLQMLNDLFKQSSLGKLADENRLHLQMVKLETRIRNDTELHAARAAADKVKTDLERRKLLRQYYHEYYSRLRAMADTPDLKTYLNGQEAAHVAILAQPRVRPDTNPAPGVAAAATPLPTPAQASAFRKLRHP